MTRTALDHVACLLAVEMTASTGELWRIIPETDNHRPQIFSPSAYLLISEDWRTKRLTITADAPHGMREKNRGETITCDPKRTPEAIARDIKSRLLQHARDHLAESKAYDHEQQKERNARNLRSKLIKKYLPKEYQNEKFCTDGDGYRERIYAHPTYDNLINIEVNLPLSKALELLKQLTKENI